jgi:hypothetical protein
VGMEERQGSSYAEGGRYAVISPAMVTILARMDESAA